MGSLRSNASSGAMLKNATSGALIKECSATTPPADIRASCNGCCFGSNSTLTATISVYQCLYSDNGCGTVTVHKPLAPNFRLLGIIAAETSVTYIQTDPSASDYNEWVSSDGTVAIPVRVQVGVGVFESIPPDANCPMTGRATVTDENKFVFLRYNCSSGAWQIGFSTLDSSGPVSGEGQGGPFDGNDKCSRAQTFWCDQWNGINIPCAPSSCLPSLNTCCDFEVSSNSCQDTASGDASTRYYNNIDIEVLDNNSCLCGDNTNCTNTSDQTNVACTEGATNCNGSQDDDCPP